VRFPNLTPRIPGNGSRSGKALKKSGEGGIRTHGTLLRYNALAKRRFRPLSHLTRRKVKRIYSRT
jgi:hypothetical protein